MAPGPWPRRNLTQYICIYYHYWPSSWTCMLDTTTWKLCTFSTTSIITFHVSYYSHSVSRRPKTRKLAVQSNLIDTCYLKLYTWFLRAIQSADIIISGGSQGGSRFRTVGPGSISLWTQTSLWGSGLEISWTTPRTAGQAQVWIWFSLFANWTVASLQDINLAPQDLQFRIICKGTDCGCRIAD